MPTFGTAATGRDASCRDLARLLAEARSLAAAFADRDEAVAERLRRSVIAPLDELKLTAAKQPAVSDPDAALVALAATATKVRAGSNGPAALLEALAALHDLVATRAPTELNRIAEQQGALSPSIIVSDDGPYLATHIPMVDWLGVPVPNRPQLALCRCGASQMKPFCDGSHRDMGFRGAKNPNRIADRRDTYNGEQLTVLDNRGICAHSGFCTDRLKNVFHADADPFVTPSGGRMDEIIRAVRACPSGALSFAIDGIEARAQVDQPRAAQIEISRDGPYRITGSIPLVDRDGAPVARNEGSSMEHYSLCRCGQSKNKPFCSGMHWTVDFRDPPPLPADREPTLFEWAGGYPALLRLTRMFYDKYVPEDPLLAPLFSEMSPDHPERVAAWLSEVFGGPKLYSERYGDYDRMMSRHLNRSLSEKQRARWVTLLLRSLEDAGLPDDPEWRAAFVAYIEWGSRIAKENSTPGAHPPVGMPVPRWWWVCDAYPDARRSALAPPETKGASVSLPSADEAVSFTAHIRPLFREGDRNSMRFVFDLWSYDDVTTHADAILARLDAGSMPCDGAWPAEQVAVFKRWVESGKPT